MSSSATDDGASSASAAAPVAPTASATAPVSAPAFSVSGRRKGDVPVAPVSTASPLADGDGNGGTAADSEASGSSTTAVVDAAASATALIKSAKSAKKKATAAAAAAAATVDASATRRRGFMLAIQIAVLESLFAMMQFVFASVLLRSLYLMFFSPLFNVSTVIDPDTGAVSYTDGIVRATTLRFVCSLLGSLTSVFIVLALLVRTRPVARAPLAVDASAAAVWAFDAAVHAGKSVPKPCVPSLLHRLAAYGHPAAPGRRPPPSAAPAAANAENSADSNSAAATATVSSPGTVGTTGPASVPTLTALRARGPALRATTDGAGDGGTWLWRVFVFTVKLGLVPLAPPQPLPWASKDDAEANARARGLTSANGSKNSSSKGSKWPCLSPFFLLVVVLHVVSTAVMWYLQKQSGVWLYSTENLMTPLPTVTPAGASAGFDTFSETAAATAAANAAAVAAAAASAAAAAASPLGIDLSRVDWLRLLDLWFTAPFCEEIVFRGVIMAHFFFKLHQVYADEDEAAEAAEAKAEADAEAEDKAAFAAITVDPSAVNNNNNNTDDGENADNTNTASIGAAAVAVTSEKQRKKELLLAAIADRTAAASAARLARARTRAAARAARRGRLRFTAALAASLFFSALHLVNFFSPKFSRVYVLLQVVMGGLIGFVYALQLFAPGRLWLCIALHAMNNLFSTPVDPLLGTGNNNADAAGKSQSWAATTVFGLPALVVFAVVESIALYLVIGVVQARKVLRDSGNHADLSFDNDDDDNRDYAGFQREAALVDEVEDEDVFGGWSIVAARRAVNLLQQQPQPTSSHSRSGAEGSGSSSGAATGKKGKKSGASKTPAVKAE